MARSEVQYESDTSSAPTRMSTRSKNATTHPGAILQDTQRIRRSKAEIAEEKELKNALVEAKKQQKKANQAKKASGEAHIKRLEQIETTRTAEKEFPRHKDEAHVHTSRGKSQNLEDAHGILATQSGVKRPHPKVKHSHKPTEMDVDDTTTTPPSKRTKTNSHGRGQPLRRTETALELMLIDEQELPSGGNVCASTRGGDTDNDQDELTPRPQKSRHQHLVELVTDDDDHFQTPVALTQKRRVVVESEDAASEEEHYPKYERRYKHEKKDLEAVIHRGDQRASGGEKKERKRDNVNSNIVRSFAPSSELDSHKTGALKKIDLRTKFKQSNSGAHRSADEDDIPPFRSGSVTQYDVDLSAFPPRSTASNGIVASQPPSTAAAPSKKKKYISDPEDDDSTLKPRAIGGLSEEDDSLEKAQAMSSPMKGNESRATKPMVKVKAESLETKPRRRASAQKLPKGAHEDAAWTRLVIPNFINLILAGEQPWIVTDDVIVTELQRVWDHVYGMKIEFTIEKGTIPFELIIQKLCDYRNKLAYKAICAVIAYFRNHTDMDEDSNLDEFSDELAEFAGDLLNTDSHGFIFKGMESSRKPKRTGTFQHTLIIQTLSAHFSNLTQGQPLKGLKIPKPRLALALTAAAVERALSLFANRMVEERIDSKGKNTKLAVRKVPNLNTGKGSKVLLEFSAAGWNQVTLDYFGSVKNLSESRLAAIFDEAKGVAMKGKPHLVMVEGPSKSSRSTLESDNDSESEGAGDTSK